jgi:hypothetical protein
MTTGQQTRAQLAAAQEVKSVAKLKSALKRNVTLKSNEKWSQ